jgi:hypothetical protein
MAFSFINALTAALGSMGGTTTALDTTGANLLVVSVAYYTGFGGAPVVSDSKSNTWSGLTARGPGNTKQRFFYAKNATAGAAHTFTVTGGTIYPSAIILAVAGADPTAPFDGENGGGSASSAGPLTTGSLTPSVANCLIVSGFASDNVTNPAVSAGLTLTTSAYVGGGGQAGATGLLVQTTAAAINPSWSWSGTQPVGIAVAAFKSDGAAAATGFRRVQATPAPYNGGGTTAPRTFGVPPAVGSAVVVAIGTFNTTVTGVTDAYSNSYTLAAARTQGAVTVAVWRCAAITATGATFTVTPALASSNDYLVAMLEVGGVGTGLTVDQSATQGGSSTTPATGATAALTGPDVLQVALHAIGAGQSSITAAVGSPVWREEAEFLSFADLPGEIDSRIVTAATGTTPSASWTDTNSGVWAAALVAFKPAAAAAVETAQPFVIYPV